MNDRESKIQFDEYDDGKMMRRSPHCMRLKPIDEFGLRNMGNGEIINQSWRKECRGY